MLNHNPVASKAPSALKLNRTWRIMLTTGPVDAHSIRGTPNICLHTDEQTLYLGLVRALDFCISGDNLELIACSRFSGALAHFAIHFTTLWPLAHYVRFTTPDNCLILEIRLPRKLN